MGHSDSDQPAIPPASWWRTHAEMLAAARPPQIRLQEALRIDEMAIELDPEMQVAAGAPPG